MAEKEDEPQKDVLKAMISSTITDLPKHRHEVKEACLRLDKDPEAPGGARRATPRYAAVRRVEVRADARGRDRSGWWIPRRKFVEFVEFIEFVEFVEFVEKNTLTAVRVSALNRKEHAYCRSRFWIKSEIRSRIARCYQD
jgi:hypothetical protein